MQTITLTDAEAAMFIEWRKHETNYRLLIASGVMDIREGSAEIHFDGEGRIGAIKAHVNVYKRDPHAAIVVIHRAETTPTVARQGQ